MKIGMLALYVATLDAFACSEISRLFDLVCYRSRWVRSKGGWILRMF